jgi:hypothetical protein
MDQMLKANAAEWEINYQKLEGKPQFLIEQEMLNLLPICVGTLTNQQEF